MKILSILLLVVLSPLSFASNKTLSQRVFSEIEVEKKSLQLDSFTELAEGHFSIIISFKILPANSCQANYAGLYVDRVLANSYSVIYATVVNARCNMSARPRRVQQKINLSLKSGSDDYIHINLVPYEITNDEGQILLKNKSEKNLD